MTKTPPLKDDDFFAEEIYSLALFIKDG